jgi:hypothetical protein
MTSFRLLDHPSFDPFADAIGTQRYSTVAKAAATWKVAVAAVPLVAIYIIFTTLDGARSL